MAVQPDGSLFLSQKVIKVKFYKYKKVIDDGYVYFRDMLQKEYAYCSKVDSFDDIFDGRMPFGKSIDEKDLNEYTDDDIKDIISTECMYLDSERHFDLQEWLKEVDEVLKKTDLSNVTIDSEITYEPTNEEIEENIKDSMNLWLFTQEKFVSYYKQVIKKLYELQKNLRIGCLTTDNKNQVLWSMYGDNFKGACIEYEIDETLPKKVIYGNRDDFDPILYSMRKFKNHENITIEEIKKLLENLLISKKDTWSFQNEYRILTFEEKIPCKITGIYFGKYLPDNCKNQIYEEFKDKYDFFNMKFNHYQQTYDFIPVDYRLYFKRHSKHR